LLGLTDRHAAEHEASIKLTSTGVNYNMPSLIECDNEEEEESKIK